MRRFVATLTAFFVLFQGCSLLDPTDVVTLNEAMNANFTLIEPTSQSTQTSNEIDFLWQWNTESVSSFFVQIQVATDSRFVQASADNPDNVTSFIIYDQIYGEGGEEFPSAGGIKTPNCGRDDLGRLQACDTVRIDTYGPVTYFWRVRSLRSSDLTNAEQRTSAWSSTGQFTVAFAPTSWNTSAFQATQNLGAVDIGLVQDILLVTNGVIPEADRMYIMGNEGLMIADLTSPNDLTLVGLLSVDDLGDTFEDPVFQKGVLVGTDLYVAAGLAGILKIDVTETTNQDGAPVASPTVTQSWQPTDSFGRQLEIVDLVVVNDVLVAVNGFGTSGAGFNWTIVDTTATDVVNTGRIVSGTESLRISGLETDGSKIYGILDGRSENYFGRWDIPAANATTFDPELQVGYTDKEKFESFNVAIDGVIPELTLPEFEDTIVYTGATSGIYVFNRDTGEALEERSIQLPGIGVGIGLDGTQAYVAEFLNTVSVYDLSNSLNLGVTTGDLEPRDLGVLPIADLSSSALAASVSGVAVADTVEGVLYATAQNAQPGRPNVTLAETGVVRGVVIEDLVVADDASTLYGLGRGSENGDPITFVYDVDVSDPGVPQIRDTLKLDTPSERSAELYERMTLVGDTLALVSREAGLARVGFDESGLYVIDRDDRQGVVATNVNQVAIESADGFLYTSYDNIMVASDARNAQETICPNNNAVYSACHATLTGPAGSNPAYNNIYVFDGFTNRDVAGLMILGAEVNPVGSAPVQYIGATVIDISGDSAGPGNDAEVAIVVPPIDSGAWLDLSDYDASEIRDIRITQIYGATVLVVATDFAVLAFTLQPQMTMGQITSINIEEAGFYFPVGISPNSILDFTSQGIMTLGSVYGIETIDYGSPAFPQTIAFASTETSFRAIRNGNLAISALTSGGIEVTNVSDLGSPTVPISDAQNRSDMEEIHLLKFPNAVPQIESDDPIDGLDMVVYPDGWNRVAFSTGSDNNFISGPPQVEFLQRVAMSSTGQMLAVFSDGTLETSQWDLNTDQVLDSWTSQVSSYNVFSSLESHLIDSGLEDGTFQLPELKAWSGIIDGSTLWVVAEAFDFVGIDISDPSSPQIISIGTPIPGYCTDVVKADATTLALACGDAGVALVDVSAPGTPFLFDLVNTSGEAFRLWSETDDDNVEIMTANLQAGYSLLNYNTSEQDVTLSYNRAIQSGSVYSIDMEPSINMIFLGLGSGGVQVLDSSNRALPIELFTVTGLGTVVAVKYAPPNALFLSKNAKGVIEVGELFLYQ